MIAALAAGALGQLEGLASASSAASGLSAVLNDEIVHAGQGRVTPAGAGPQNGRAPALSTLSDQLQTLLLNQQSASGAAAAVNVDDVPGAASLG